MKGEIATRYREFEIPGTAQVVEGNGGLPKVRITTPDVIGEIYLHGAHITSLRHLSEVSTMFSSTKNKSLTLSTDSKVWAPFRIRAALARVLRKLALDAVSDTAGTSHGVAA